MILITGSRGFIGRYLGSELLRLGRRVLLATSDREACVSEGVPPLCYLDLSERTSLKELPDNIDAVIHLAAVTPKKDCAIDFSRFIEVNALGAKRLVDAVVARGCKRFVYASTQMVIDKPFYLPVDEKHPLAPQSDYGLSKAIGERYCLSEASALGLSCVSLRLARVYGPGESPGYVLTNFIDRAAKKLPLVIHGTGKTKRDLIYVKDVVRAFLHALESDRTGAFNIGGGCGVSIKELAKTISEVFSEGTSPIKFEKAAKEKGNDFFMDITKAKKELGFSPAYTLREGLLDYKAELLTASKL